MKLRITVKFTITIVLLCGLWYGATFLFVFRMSNLRWLYHTGWISCYLFCLAALVLSLVNIILILKEFNRNWKLNFLQLIISVTPILYWAYMSSFIYVN